MRQMMAKVIRTWQGGVRPVNVALAVGLGLCAGFVTGANYTFLALVMAATVLNVHTASWACAWGLGWIAAILLQDFTDQVGCAVLDQTPLGSLIAHLGNGPVAALFDLDRYTLIGGLALGLPLGLIAAAVVARPMETLDRLVRLGERKIGWRGQRRPWPRRLATVMVYGATATSRQARLAAESGWSRPRGWTLALFLAGAGAVLPWWLGPVLCKRHLLACLTQLNGADVSAGRFEISLWTGKLIIDDLHLADPHRLDRNHLQIGHARANVEPGNLLRGKLHIEKLRMWEVRSDVARRYTAHRSGNQALRIGIAQRTKAPARTRIDLEGYIRHWNCIRDGVAWMGQVVSAIEGLPACETIVPLGRRRSNLGGPAPCVRVDQLIADTFVTNWGLGQRTTFEAHNLTSDPGASGKPTRLEITSPELAAALSAELRLHELEKRHAARFEAFDVPLKQFVDNQQTARTLQLSGGNARLEGDGWMSKDGLDLAIRFEARRVDVRVLGARPIAGVDPAVWDDGLSRLAVCRGELQVAGPWSAPKLSIEPARLVKHLKHQLRAAGEHDLVQTIERQLAGIPRARLTGNQAANPQPPKDAGYSLVSDGIADFDGSSRSNSLRGMNAEKALANPLSNPDGASGRDRIGGDSLQAQRPRYPETKTPADDLAGWHGEEDGDPSAADAVNEVAESARMPGRGESDPSVDDPENEESEFVRPWGRREDDLSAEDDSEYASGESHGDARPQEGEVPYAMNDDDLESEGGDAWPGGRQSSRPAEAGLSSGSPRGPRREGQAFSPIPPIEEEPQHETLGGKISRWSRNVRDKITRPFSDRQDEAEFEVESDLAWQAEDGAQTHEAPWGNGGEPPPKSDVQRTMYGASDAPDDATDDATDVPPPTSRRAGNTAFAPANGRNPESELDSQPADEPRSYPPRVRQPWYKRLQAIVHPSR